MPSRGEEMIDPQAPLIDLHRHLDGNVRLETIIDIGREHNINLPAWDVESLRPYVQVTDPQPGVMAFLARFEWMTAVMVDYDACWRIAYENVEDAQGERLDYVELRFSPLFMSQTHNLDPVGIVEAVVAGVEAGRRDFKQPVNLIGILSRTYGPETAWNELNALLTQRDHIVALDLAGDEANFPGELFVDHFRQARQAGWQATVHAGELDGAKSIWQALNELGAARIGHAVHALEDAVLMDYMKERGVGIEVNLTSNVQTSTVASYETHPLKHFLEKGLLATLCSDDPGISRIDLEYEYEVAAPAAGLTPGQIRQAQTNALEIAFLSREAKEDLRHNKTSPGRN
jgi:adenosine deaminase